MTEQQEYTHELYMKALEYAREKHKGQKRLDGKPYITHPIEVANSLLDNEEKIIALLHDIIEDTATPESEIIKEFGYKIGWQVDILTRDPMQESYEEYINRIKRYGPETVRQVKIADLKHNLGTIYNIPNPDKRKRLKDRYEKALKVLE